MSHPPEVGWHPEIERKFLLDRIPDAVREHEPVEIEQGWLRVTGTRLRLRRESSASEVRWLRTEKRGRGAERIEREEELGEREFLELWPATAGRRLRKRRWRIPVGALCWEIDDFEGRALVLAEIEIPTADTEVEIPPWLAPHVVREVTDDPAYLNVTLAGARDV